MFPIDLVHFSCCLGLLFPFDFLLVVLYILESRVLGSPTVFAELSISSFKSVSFCAMHFGILLLGAFMLIIVWLPDELTHAS